jgi:hypothetical protein
MTDKNAAKILEAVPPSEILETDQADLIRGGVACMYDVETVKRYVAYENQNERRRRVLRMLAARGVKLRKTP